MNQRGQTAEKLARNFLESQGLTCLASNMQCRVGEIDLIMRDADELAFVEVRSRRAGAHVDAISSINKHKQQRIIRASRYWLSRNPQWFDQAMRFDVVAIDGDQLHWERDAFETSWD